jgi:hypothetical protein
MSRHSAEAIFKHRDLVGAALPFPDESRAELESRPRSNAGDATPVTCSAFRRFKRWRTLKPPNAFSCIA